MGAENIEYYVPYQADVSRALRDLQQEILASGDFIWLDHPDLGWPRIESINDGQSTVQPYPKPTSLQELDDFRKWQDDLGNRGDDLYFHYATFETYTALDMRGISTQREWGKFAPLSDDELIRYYGTTKPTRDVVEAYREVDFWEDLDRGYGVYFIVYTDEKPTEIYFGFYSND